jgi:uncharacterized protein YeaO (DUF488 family)
MIAIKRAYAAREPADGYRVLVDRLWPRGFTREKLAPDEWAKAIAPSTELRNWYRHQADLWPEFQARYRRELATPEAKAALKRLRGLARRGNLTLLTATGNETRNHAVVLKGMLSGRKTVRPSPSSG